MVTRNGQPAEHTVPGFAGRLTRGELDAYNSAFKAIRSDFAELEKLQTQVNRLARIRWDHPASLRHFTSLKTADGTQWDAYGILLKSANSEVLLCQKVEGTEWAAIQRLPTDGPYARGHGTTEVLVNGDDARAVTTEYASPAQHTLRFMASNLMARAQKVAWEQFPDHNPKRVVHALSERCYEALGEKEVVKQAQSVRQTQRCSRSIGV